MEKGISYLNRNFADYKEALIEFSEKYYPDLNTSWDDASVASWMIDLMASIADNESYHIDRVYQETNIESAQERASLMAIARNNGVKIPGPKGSMAEMRITFTLPADLDGPNWKYAPIVKRGTRFSASSQQFELLTDVDFANQFDENGNSDRTIRPVLNTNGIVAGYTVSKLAVVVAGESRIYKQEIRVGDIKPFMEIMIPVEGVMNIESILVTDSQSSMITPSYSDFYGNGCDKGDIKFTRFYEVDNLAQTDVWTDIDDDRPVTYTYLSSGQPIYCVAKGEWRPVDHKFITEYTDKGYLKVIFGAGVNTGNVEIGNDAASFSKWQITKILNNNNLGVLPSTGTAFILYRLGGGAASNLAKGSITRVSYLNADFRGEEQAMVERIMQSMRVENTTPSISGKDMPSEKELKYLIKYHNAAQERCVTVKDYVDRILMLPPRYGTPFRVGVSEENNKIMIYLLGIDYEGKLDSALPMTLIKNIEDYLAKYRMVNDYVEIKAGRIINLAFDIDLITDKNYNKSDVISNVIDTVISYMDVNKHLMGEEIYIGDLEKEISKIDGVINLIDLRVSNMFNGVYSTDHISQEIIEGEDEEKNGNSDVIDLEATDGILYADGDTMFEIKKPDTDIRIRVKER